MNTPSHIRRFPPFLLSCCLSLGTMMAGQQDYPRVPTVTSPPGMYQAKTKTNVVLPSKQHHLQADLRRILVELPPFDLQSIKDRETNQIGVNRSVGISSRSHGQRFTNSDGTHILLLAIKSPGAVRMRVHFTNVNLPAGDTLYVYGISEDAAVAGPYNGKGLWNSGDFWSSSIEGDTVIIEYFSRTSESAFNIPEISHIYERIADGHENNPDLLGCHIDASCSTASEKNAVGRIVFTTTAGSFVCSGTLLNDRANDHVPYFLTANHCVSTQTIAQTVEIYWFYQTTACNSGALRTWAYSGSGADLLVTQSSNDFALIRLVDSAPPGATFSGWDPNAIAVNTPVRGFHHPDGYTPPSTVSYLRRSDGSISSTNNSCSATGLSNGLRVNWTSGSTEHGSSGSGLWYTGQSAYLVGVLSCGPDPVTCTNPFAVYSKFSQFYSQIRPFIDPVTGGSAPTAITVAPTNVSGASATLHGTVNPNGLSTTAYFQYGLTSSYGSSSAPGNLGSGTTNLDVQTTLTTSPNTTYHYRIVASNSAGTTNGNDVAFATPGGGNSSRLGNISTRLLVLTGDNALIGGFIVSGTQAKRVLLRAIGPSLPVSGALPDPTLALYNGSGGLLWFNDDWQTGSNGFPSQQAEIIGTGIPPGHNYESAIVATLPANNSAYTAIVRGYNNATGVGLVEVYDLDQTVNSKLANISTRGLVTTGDNVMIGGTIIIGSNQARVLFRAIGPSLTNLGVPNALSDTTLELRDGNGNLIAFNDDWRFRSDGSSQQAEIEATGIPPTNVLESALVQNLAPASYTAIVRGYSNFTGVALVEAYQLQ